MKYEDIEFLKTVRDFLTVYLPKQRHFSENTVRSYRMALNLYFDYLREQKNISFHTLSFDHLNKDSVSGFIEWLQEERNCSDTTCNQRLMAIRSFARYAAISDPANIYVQADIGKVPVKKCESKVVEFFSDDALKALLDQPNRNTRTGSRNSCFMIMMYDTAARCQEMLDLKIKDLVLDGKSPYVYLTGKGNKTRTVPLMEKTVSHLQIYLDRFHPDRNKNDYLFYTVIHNVHCQMSPDTVAAFLKKYAASARKTCDDIPPSVHPHQFRHTRAITWYRNGVPLVLVAELLGHADVNTSQIYAYADTEMKRAAISKAMGTANAGTMESNDTRWKGDDVLIKKLFGLM
ncbi:MAG: site-specific integrase [Mogibacterium sp.]|nr:site-specific integrase [Mogibacterium sp.]